MNAEIGAGYMTETICVECSQPRGGPIGSAWLEAIASCVNGNGWVV